MASNMEAACAENSDSDCSDWSDDRYSSDDSDSSDDSGDSNEELSGSDADCLAEGTLDERRYKKHAAKRAETNFQPCKYYNKRKCKDRNCVYLHICKYYFKGYCKYGAKCRLSHRMRSATESSSSHQNTLRRTKRRPAGKHYQWQIEDGNGWSDIESDDSIEAQYSLPWVNGIKLDNSRDGLPEAMGHLDLSGQCQRYIWQFEGNHGKWHKFKRQHGTNTVCSVTSREIECEYRQNQHGCMTFYVNNSKFRLDFSAMTQTNLSNHATRSVRRVPPSL